MNDLSEILALIWIALFAVVVTLFVIFNHKIFRSGFENLIHSIAVAFRSMKGSNHS